MSYCYIIYSKKIDRFYVGSCQGDLNDRINKHNTSFYEGQHYTSQASDWQLHLSISCESFLQARKIENHIKAMKSRKYLTDLKSYPDMIEKLLFRFGEK